MEHELEPSAQEMRAWIDAAAELVVRHVTELATAPAMGPTGPDGALLLPDADPDVPEEAGSLTSALATVSAAAGASLLAPGPGYLAYVPGGGLYAAAVADFVACCLNRFTGLAGAAPGLVRLEHRVLRWFAAEFDFGDGARGLLTSGGSIANLTAVVTARHDRLGPGADLRRAVLYTSTQAHHSIEKAAYVAGIGLVRRVAVDASLRLDPAALAAAVAADRAEGLAPFLVVAAAGTTNTGAIDPLGPLADLCAAEALWLHVDGAYGGAFVLCPEGRERLAGLARADSVTFDPHKAMFLPYGTGCLLVRDGRRLRAANLGGAPTAPGGASYLRDLGDEPYGLPSPADHGPELSRDFRGLRVWLPLMVHGAGAFRRALSEKLALARWLYDALEGDPHIERVVAPQLSTVAVRLRRRAGEDLAAYNARNAAWLRAVNDRRKVHLSSTTLPVIDGDAVTVRICVLSFRTHAAQLATCLEELRATCNR